MKRTHLLSEPASEPASERTPEDSGPRLRAAITRFSDRLIAAQRPLRLLDAIAWDDQIERAFFASEARELPPVDLAYYHRRTLTFDPAEKRAELTTLALDVSHRLGEEHAASRLLLGRCRQYLGVVEMLEARGTADFAAASARLYGDSGSLPSNGGGLRQLARELASMVAGLELNEVERTLGADESAAYLSHRLRDYFGGLPVRVRVTDRLASDAAAGAGYIKLRAGARFTVGDLRLLEVHEGWVHLGTTLNGLAQPTCGFLSRATPAAAVAQEGLAVLVEVLSFASHPARLRRLAQRVEAVGLAESGADFLEVYRHFVAAGGEPRESYRLAARTFRGSLPDGGPFTKDLSYSRGLVEVCRYLRQTIQQGKARTIPLLFAGKVSLDEMPLVVEMQEEGLLAPPTYVPPPFAELRALCAWLCCAGWLASAC